MVSSRKENENRSAILGRKKPLSFGGGRARLTKTGWATQKGMTPKKWLGEGDMHLRKVAARGNCVGRNKEKERPEGASARKS